MPPDIEAAVARNRRQFVRGIEAPLVRQALRDYARVLSSVERDALRLARQVEEQGGVATYAQAVRMEQLQSLYDDVQSQVTRILDRELGAVLAARREAALMGTTDALALVRSVTPPAAHASLSTVAGERMMAAVGPDTPLRRLIDRMPAEAGLKVRDALVDGVVRGDNPRVTAAAVRRALNGQALRAMTIARTETMRAYRNAAVDTYRANSDVVEGWVWISARDERACVVCWSMHGTVHGLNETLDSHPACRCVASPLPVTADPALTPEVALGEDVFAALPEEAQRRILGPAALEAYQDGAVTLPDFVGVARHPEWGRVRFRRSLTAVLGPSRARGFFGRAA